MVKQAMSQESKTYMPSSEPEDKRKTRDVQEALAQYQSAQQSVDNKFTEMASEQDFPVPMLKIPGQEDRPLTPELASILLQVTNLLSSGKAIYMMACDAQLTTQEAADLLGISRPTLVKILENGKIPFTTVGRHRRIRLDDLQQYAEERHTEHVQIFDELSEDEDPTLTLENPLIHK